MIVNRKYITDFTTPQRITSLLYRPFQLLDHCLLFHPANSALTSVVSRCSRQLINQRVLLYPLFPLCVTIYMSQIKG